MYRYRKTVIVLWCTLAIVLGLFAWKMPSILEGSGFETEGSFNETQTILKEDFNQPKSTMTIIIESEKYTADSTEYKAYVQELIGSLDGVDFLNNTTSPYQNKKMTKDNIAYIILGFDKSFTDLKGSIEQIRERLIQTSDFKASLTGGAVISEDMNEASQNDLKRAEAIGIPAALVILLFSFGGVVAAIIPLLIGIISVVSSLGILYFLGLELDLSIFLLNVVPMIGLALGIDFALLLVNRFREEIKRNSIEQAINVSIQTAGRSIAFSGLCVFLGLSSMLFIDIDIFQTVAIGGMVVVILSVICALTFLPAILGMIGPNINKWMVLKTKEKKVSNWYRFAKFVMHRPMTMLMLSLLILITAILPLANLNLTIPEAEALPESYESRQAFETFKNTFGEQELYPVTMIVDGNDALIKQDKLNDIEELQAKLEDEKIVDRIESLFSTTNLSAKQIQSMVDSETLPEEIQGALNAFVQEDKSILRIYLNVDTTSEMAKDFVRDWNGSYNGYELILGGNSTFTQEIFDEIYNKAPYAVGFVLISTYFILLIAFRSLFIPLKAILMNVISLSATFGIIVWIFQEGHFVDPTNGIGLMIPVFTFGIVFGLSMDYEVFLISRIQEYYHESKDNDYATLMGLTSTSKIITSAALIMIVVTGAFAFTGVVPVKQMGVSIALAIFLDATLVRMVLVPSLMKLMGHWNWWMPWKPKDRKLKAGHN
ncbi:MMPL family transporter [Pseudalkalibacillus berkeleyi]|uniref:MMPL family transporter n=1 Tax=Pseudalkalibacillus berkeleyi TaxID=1069813 RepID=A0ABS9GZQ6_9BACL|nr:MMPL family transporter [Pseudalkalibacillus berkeleyi]MCF6137311.1 MMPL family transporter [Pseudalkalibacillus berkeleyi]